MSNSKYGIFDKEHFIGVIIGILPLIAIWVIFRNNELQYIAWLKHCGSLAGGVSVFVAFTDIFTKNS
jgi:hypothetical protein